VIFLAAALAGLAFGAADQYLGSLRSMLALGPWAVSVSQMSAPWLLLPFAFGCTQNRARRAMLLGLVATVAALVGYLAMTVSPVENVALRAVPSGAWAWIRTNLPVIVGGLVTGPVFGLLGQRWRVERWWPSAALVAGAFVLEPLARQVDGRLLGPAWIWPVEMALGLALAAAFLMAGAARGRSAGVA
jgi:hypothetical protein